MMYLLFSFVAAAVFAQGGGNGGGNGGVTVVTQGQGGGDGGGNVSPTPPTPNPTAYPTPTPTPNPTNGGPTPGTPPPFGNTCESKREEPMDVFFLVDGSSSIGSHHNMTNYDPSAWPGQLRFVKKLIENTLTVEGDRVGIYQFSIKNGTYATDPDHLGTMEYELDTPVQDIIDTVQNMEQRLGGTPTKEAIDVAIQQFVDHEIQGEDRQRLLVIVTDGDPTCAMYPGYDVCHDPCHNMEGIPLATTSVMLGIHNVKTVVIGVNNEAEKLKCLVQDPEVNIVKISDFNSFEDYRDPTGDENLLCVNPQELELKCCRAKSTLQLGNIETYDNYCRKKAYGKCIDASGCGWGVSFEGVIVDGCGVTLSPTAEPTVESSRPTVAPTRLTCVPMHNCVVKGGEKVFGWPNAGGRMKASSACACAERCEMEGGTDSKWHIRRQICKCWKAATHIIQQVEPFDANRKHGGNAGGKTQCVKSGNSVAEETFEVVDSTAVPSIPAPPTPPTAAVTPEPSMSPEEYAAYCEEKKQGFLNSVLAQAPYHCTWNDDMCREQCA